MQTDTCTRCGSEGCLCDVVVRAPIPIMSINFASDSLYAKRICESLGIVGHMDDDDMLAFFEMQCRVHDALFESSDSWVRPKDTIRGVKNPKRVNAKVTDEMRKYIAMRCHQGVRNTDLLRELVSVFGYKMKPQYLSHLRRRMGLPPSLSQTGVRCEQ